MLLEDGQKILFAGDSVTDDGRARPVGEGNWAALGNGFVRLIDSCLAAEYPERKIHTVNMGISGNTSRDLLARWETDVNALKPDWVVLCIGFNDVWRQFDCPLQTERHVLPEEYRSTLEFLVRETLPRVKGLVLVTPVFMDTNRQDPMRARCDEYAAIVRDIAQRTGALLADPQVSFDRYFAHCHPMSMSWDYVHPNLTGHMMIAEAIYQALDA